MAQTTVYHLILILTTTCHQVVSDTSYADQDVMDSITPNHSTSLTLPTPSAQPGNKNPETASVHSPGSICAYYDDHPAAGANREEYIKLFYSADGRVSGGKDSLGVEVFPNNNTVRCLNYCFTLWVADPRNKSIGTVSKQGCWLISDVKECLFNSCVSSLPPGQNNTHFCCCSGHMCNEKYLDVYNPAEHTTATTHAAQLAVGNDKNYKVMTIFIALMLVFSVSGVIVFLYLAYRLYDAYGNCLNRKPTSPQSSSVTGVEIPDTLLPEFNISDLKIQDVLVRGRYSEVRKGLLRNKEVAVKIYQPHHRQYYHNERNAFTQPFMDHENIVKFFGAKEQEDPETNFLQYLIVTEYISLGSLTSYLKHNTVTWSMLCHMCQGISRGLAYLHTDIQKEDLFKPAIAHRDLNTRNILVTPDLTCVIADLGFSVGMIGSKIIKNGVAENAEQATLADVGTLRYMAPEVFDGAVNLRDCEASLKQIDVYSLGLVMWEIAARCIDLYQGAPVPEYQLPFQAEAGPHPTFEEMQVLVVKYKTRPRFPEVWKDANPAVRSLKETIEDCWDTDAEARLTSLCVQERVADMVALWAQGNKHRGVTPTLNTTFNLPEGSQNGVIHSSSAVVSNGVTYLPSYVDRNNETNEELGDFSMKEELKSQVMPANLRIYDGSETMNLSHNEDISVTAPLISNVGCLDNNGNNDSENCRVRSWIHDQSLSGSTVDTMLPPTPSFDEGTAAFDVHVPQAAADLPPVKASNIMIAVNKAVILHPNQGRNPTVERNTHKCSDEELTVSGNVLLGPGNQMTNSESDRSNRRGSFDARSAPPNRNGDGGSFDRTDAVEYSSLVQNDSLGQYNNRPRNMPIPYFQNHVHGENLRGMTVASHLTRPKLANVSGNRNLYLLLQGEDFSPEQQPTSFQTAEKIETKSLKHKLSRFIRPKDFRQKISQIVFGKRKTNINSCTTPSSFDVESVIGRGEDVSNRVAGQYVNSGLDASPVNRNTASINTFTPEAVAMEVQILNGSYVTRACIDKKINNPQANQTPALILDPQGRPSATNVMRIGILANPNVEELASPSLFPKSGASSFISEHNHLLTGEQEHSLPLHNLVTTDYGSMHSVILSQAYDNDADTSEKDLTISPLLLTSGTVVDANKPDYHLSEKIDGSNANNYLTKSNNYMDNFVNFETRDKDTSQLSDGGSVFVGCSSSDIASFASANDPYILNTVIQSPQNKTINPLNKSFSLSGGYNPNHITKGSSQNIPKGPHTSLSFTSCQRPQDHYTDTKGGNSIMHNIHMDPNKNSPRSSCPLALVPAHQQNRRHSLQKNTDPSPILSESQRELITDFSSTCSSGKFYNSNERLSSQKSMTDQQKHINQAHLLTTSENPAVKSRFDAFLPELDLSQSLTSSERRPKSLSLNGHNYKQSRNRGRSASSSSLSSSTNQRTSKAFLLSKETKDKAILTTSATPDVTPDKNSLHIQDSNSVAPSSTTAEVSTISTGVSFGTLTVHDSTNNSGNKINMTNYGISCSTSSPQNGCSFSSAQNYPEDCTTSPTNTARLYCTGESSGSKESHTMIGRSDSSEKIRKRIKTPVSFKKNRLSLYDDRLMTQSLGFVSLSDVDGSDIQSVGGDNNNNDNNNTGLCNRHQEGGGEAPVGKSDYYKMIKSESDLIV